MKKRGVLIFAVWALAGLSANAQFWVGPRIGTNVTRNTYDDKDFRKAYDVPVDVSMSFGISMDYETEGPFQVHSEITYDKIGNKITSKDELADLNKESNHHFLTFPIVARYVFTDIRKPIKFYAQLGPKIKYWVSGDGKITADEFIEFGISGYDYEVAFKNVARRDDSNVVFPSGVDNSTAFPGAEVNRLNYALPVEVNTDGTSSARGSGREYIAQNANRIQYSIDFGVGAFIDLESGQRVNIDLRFSWGHSNMGFNKDGDDIGMVTFDDDLEYHHNMVTLSTAFLFGYDPTALKKGKSTQGGRRAR